MVPILINKMCLSLVIIQWFKTDSPKPQLLLYQSNKILHASQSGQKKKERKKVTFSKPEIEGKFHNLIKNILQKSYSYLMMRN